MAGEGGEGGGELHRIEEGVGRLLLVRHRRLAAIQGLPTSQVLLWLRLQSSESAGWGAGPPVYLGTWPPPNTGPLLPTGFPLYNTLQQPGPPPIGLCLLPHRLCEASQVVTLSSELSFALERREVLLRLNLTFH